MSLILIENAQWIITMDDERRELANCSILIEDNKIAKIAPKIDRPAGAEIIDASRMWVFPGLINTHHHLYQSLTRCLPQVQQVELFPWLKTLYPIWSHLTSEGVYFSALVGMGELVRSGCTTVSDHHYVFPNGQSGELIDSQIAAAKELGVRFHPCRGSMSRSVKDGGLPPDSVVQEEQTILADSERVINNYHDNSPYSMCQIVLAPCSPFSVTTSLMEETVKLARKHGVHCHTHLAETLDEEEFCLQLLGSRPLEYMEQVGWLGEDIWFAHGIHFTEEELAVLAKTQTGVAHCPVSNMKLSSGVAKIPAMLSQGVPVGLGVDGSASNDGGNMLYELKSALLLHKLTYGIDSISARDVLAMATRGGARLLGRTDIGYLAEGMAADLFMVSADRLCFAGAASDPVTALVTSQEGLVDTTIVNGRIIVRKQHLAKLDEDSIARRAQQLSLMMIKEEQ